MTDVRYCGLGLTALLLTKFKADRVHTTVVHPAWVRTPLAKNLDDSSLPWMDASDVANPILEQIFACRSKQLIMPGNAVWLSTLRAMPHWVQNTFRANISRGPAFKI